MLSKSENETLTHIGPGTLMGGLLRQYWIPAFVSAELASPDCPPTRVRLLGENLIGFRTTSGQIGLVANACPHRGASLFFGRNEEEGLRCVYHGWKFDTTGQCVDMPSEPAESNFKTKVRATAYPCVERGGIVWAYMGPRETPPSLPDIEANMQPEGEYTVSKTLRECNWVQALEGDIDTSHLGFLHLGAVPPESAPPGSMDFYTLNERNPSYDVRETAFGNCYGAYRPAEADTYYWRVANFLFPFYTMIPTGALGVQILARAWVPADDENCHLWSLGVPRTRTIGQGTTNTPALNFGTNGVSRYLPDTTDWLGRFRMTANKRNDYLIDRELQKTARSGIGYTGLSPQDEMITESMGVIMDRTHEHLAASDSMIIRTRRRLMAVAKELQEQATVPPGVDEPAIYGVRSGGVILPRNVDWWEATKELRKAFVEHKPEEVFAPVIATG